MSKTKKGQEVKRPKQNFQMPRISFKGTGTYTPPPDAAEKERAGN